MKTRSRRPAVEDPDALAFDDFEGSLDIESLSDEELEDFLFEDEPQVEGKSILNLPTVAGLSLITVGIAYLFQQLGILSGFSGLSSIAAMLPWLAGVLIILLGFGVLSWRPASKRKVKKAIEVPSGKKKVIVQPPQHAAHGRAKRRLERSRNKKIAGVCGGLAEYFRIDPTLVRIAFVIGMISTTGMFLAAYLLLAFVMPAPPPRTLEDRITIIRDS